jgi:DNA-directed RNA polymerase subunit E'/Rpb7
MDNDVFMNVLLDEKIKLEPRFITNNFKEELLKRLKEKLEGKCTRHGYIRINSIDIYKITPGIIELISLNGNIQYKIYFHADVCNPMLGSVIKAKVMKINKFGILADAGYNDPVTDEFLNIIEIIIAKNSVNIISDIDLETVNVGDNIRVEIIGKKYELNDKHISIVGKIVSEIKNNALLNNPENDLDQDDDQSEVEEIVDIEDEEEEIEDELDPDEEDIEELDDEDEEVEKKGGDLFSDDDDNLYEDEDDYDLYNDEEEVVEDYEEI